MPPKPVSSSQHTAKLGGASQDPNKDKTWDGYKKFNNIPVDPTNPIPTKIPLTAEETVQQKINLIRKLNHIEKKGIKLALKKAENADLNIVVIEPKNAHFTGVLKSLVLSLIHI